MRNFKVLAYCEFSKFTWDQSDWLEKVELGTLEKARKTNLKYCGEQEKYFGCRGKTTRVLVPLLIKS
jgi:hypothetical protein